VRRQPDRADAQVAQVVQPLRDAMKITDAITIPIGKTSRVNLVEYGGLPPWLCGWIACHIFSSFVSSHVAFASAGVIMIGK
jgi:hypothetical protein